MTAETDVHVGEVSSPTEVPNGNATADGSCVFVNGNGSGADVVSGDPADADLNFITSSGELSDKHVVEECNKQSPDHLKAEEHKIEAESQESVVIVSDNHVDQESMQGALVDRGVDADQNCESDVSIVVNGDQSAVQENENDSSENVDGPAGHVPVETVALENHVADSPADSEQNLEAAASCIEDDNQLDPPVVTGSNTEESERVLANGHAQDGILETGVNELVDSNQETPELTTSAELAESLPSLQTTPAALDDVKRETEIGNLVVGGSEITDSHPVDNANVIEAENGLVGIDSVSSRDVRLEIETGEKGSILDSSDSHPAGKSNVIESEYRPVGNDNVSSFPSSDARLETETEEKGSILANDGSNTKSEDSEGVTHCADEQPIPIDNAAVESCKSDLVEKGTSLVNGSGADVKVESEIENMPVVSCRDVPNDDAVVSESKILSQSVISTSEVVLVENGPILSAGGESDDQRYKGVEENEGIQVTSADIDDQRYKEVEAFEEIQVTSACIQNQRCKKVEETEEIHVNAADIDDQRFKEVEGSEESQVTSADIDGQRCKEAEEIEEIQVTAAEIDDQKPKEVEETEEIQVNAAEIDDQKSKEVEENVEIQVTSTENGDQRCKEVEENDGIQINAAEIDDQKPKEVEETEEIQVNAAEIDDQKSQEVEENEEIQVTSAEIGDQRCKEVEETDGIQINAAEIDDQVKELEQNEEIQVTAAESDDQRCDEVKEDEEIRVTGGESDDKSCQGVEETEEIQFTRRESGDKTCWEVEGVDGIHRDERLTSTPEDSTVNASETQNVSTDVVKRPFYFLIRVPRYDIETLREQIKSAQSVVDEKTQSRDVIRDEIQTIRVTYKKYAESLEVALSEERAARELLKSKRQEIDSVQSVINKMKNAISVEDIDGRIRNMEHMIAHETLPLKEEKQFIRDIKQLKQLREQFSSNMGKQDDVQQAFDQKDQIEERLKLLRKEVDSLREHVLKAEAATQAVRKQHRDESEKLKKLLSQFKAADDIRQEAYKHFQSLKKQAYDKNKYFWEYKDDAKQANDLVFKGDREALQHLCVNQVERVMELWNKNDEFRKEYVKSNVRSTLRRLKTLDGRSLGPDEEPPVIRPVVSDKIAKDNSQLHISTLKSEKTEQVVPVKSEKVDEKPSSEVREQKIPTAKPKKPAKLSPSVNGPTTVSVSDETEEAREEEPKRSKEEEELARKAEELRKEEEAAKLKEQRRLEEKEKAKEALERRKRMAEKAQARAALRVQKEAEQKEKEREKRLRKKEKRKGAAVEDAGLTNEEESTPSSETTTLETAQTSELREKPTTVTKRPQKPSQFTRQTTKAKSIPMPLRNRGKRRMQTWMWILVAALIIFALFLLGNGSFSSKFGLQGFRF